MSLSGLVEWVEVTSPPGVRDRLASIGNALVERYGLLRTSGDLHPS